MKGSEVWVFQSQAASHVHPDTLTDIVPKIAALAGIKHCTTHDLRHTFASWLVMEGVPLFEVSKLLRHASIQMTERYAHLAPDYLHDAVANLVFLHVFSTLKNPRRQCSTRMA